MSKLKKTRNRKDRIHNEAVVDAYGPKERVLGWYYYLENQLRFPYETRCIVAMVVSPLSKKVKPSRRSVWYRQPDKIILYKSDDTCGTGRKTGWRV